MIILEAASNQPETIFESLRPENIIVRCEISPESAGPVGRRRRNRGCGSLAVVFRDRKFGFEILVTPESTLERKRIVFPLKAALRVLEEEFLEPAANEQIHHCRVAVINHFGEFSHRYQYFRGKVDELFAQAETR